MLSNSSSSSLQSEQGPIQQRIQEQLPTSEIDYPLPGMRQVASVVDLSHKLVFEIAIESLSVDKLLAKGQAYASLGYTVVWILHDSWANQAKLSLAEALAGRYLYYFAASSPERRGEIYDQLEITHRDRRVYKSCPYRVHFQKCRKAAKVATSLRCLRRRPALTFSGDVLDCVARGVILAAEIGRWEQLERQVDRKANRSTFSWPGLGAMVAGYIEYALCKTWEEWLADERAQEGALQERDLSPPTK